MKVNSTGHVLMITPHHFRWSEETAEDNAFMNEVEVDEDKLRTIIESHNGWVELLGQNGIKVHLLSHPESTPDAVFPNNWVSVHGKFACLYPMKHKSRSLERDRPDILQLLEGLGVEDWVDLSHFEEKNLALEGTGSLVLDHMHAVAYLSISRRGEVTVAQEWVKLFSEKDGRDWKLICFNSTHKGSIVYHTNVVMSIGTRWAVCCFDCITATEEAQAVRTALEDTGRTIISITADQVSDLCGNILELDNRLVAMSTTSFNAFDESQLDQLREANVKIIHHDLQMLEQISGGGIRCCMAEIFLPDSD